MKTKAILTMFLLILFPVAACAQTKDSVQPKIDVTNIDGTVPANDAYIVKYYVDKAASDSSYETGSLHIVYSDKTEVVEKLRPKENSSANSIVFNEEGITDPKVAADKRTIAWTEQFDNCCTSYSIRGVLAVYRSGKNIVHIDQGQMVWDWMFCDGGKRIAAEWGTVHFSDIGDYQLYDTESGRLIDEVMGDAEVEGRGGTIHGLGPNAPVWAKDLEKQH